jgi:hypothetical protein
MRIQLETALGNCKFQHLSTCNTKHSFEETDEAVFYVYDEEGGESEKPVRIVGVDSTYQLTVKNDLQKQIHFVKTDKCLIEKEISKCDCLLFDDKQFFFVEIKNSSTGSRKSNRVKAVSQLKSTIDLLIEKNIELKEYKTTALICFKSNYPRIIQASKNLSRAFFMEQYNIYLDEGNEIVF